MYRCIMLASAVACVGLLPACSSMALSTEEAIGLVLDGKPACVIVIPDNAGKWERTAASWLQEYVEKSTGAKLPISQEKSAPRGTLISIGHTRMARAAGIRTDDLKYDGCKMVVAGQVLYLIGRDVPGIESSPDEKGEISGYELGARGTCRAVTRFLENVLGVRWFVPTSEGERVRKARDLTISRGGERSFSPAFAYGHGRYIYGVETPAAIANNFRTSVLIRSYGGHSYYTWVPAKEYAETHPEYFAMTKGKRDASRGHLCTTNPEVRELLKKALFADFEKGYEWVALGQTDGFRRCQCPACEKLDGYRGWTIRGWTTTTDRRWEEKLELLKNHPCERIHLTHKWLIDEARKAYPGRKVHMLAYGPTVTPSRRFDYYGDNAVMEICCNADPRVVKLWKGKAAGNTVYVCWFDVTLKYGMDIGFPPAEAAKRVRFLRDNGVIGMYFGGGGTNWGFMGPTYYVLGRMMGEPDLDHRVLFEEYCTGLYGNASEEMQAFYEALYPRLTIEPRPGVSFAEMQLERYTPAVLAQLEDLLSKAEAKAENDRNRNFIVMTRDQFDYNELLTHAFAAHAACKKERTPTNWQRLKKAVEAFDAFRQRVVRYDDEFVAKYYPGHGKFCNYLTSRGSSEVYYSDWRERREEVLAKPLRGTVIGYGYNRVREPLTTDFSGPPPPD